MEPQLRRIIVQRSTNRYLRNDGTWTDTYRLAARFPSIPDAIAAQERHGLTDVALVLQIGPKPSNQYDIVLPLSNLPAHSRATNRIRRERPGI
jgi:hypothetical protein